MDPFKTNKGTKGHPIGPPFNGLRKYLGKTKVEWSVCFAVEDVKTNVLPENGHQPERACIATRGGPPRGSGKARKLTIPLRIFLSLGVFFSDKNFQKTQTQHTDLVT